MKSFEDWMNEYGESHRNRTNILIHEICVPLIFFSVLGLLWSIPVPQFFVRPWLNWATVLAAIALVFYLSLNFLMFLGMLIQVILMCLACYWLQQQGVLIPVAVTTFVLAWIAQFYGHKIEGKKPSFFQDLTFLMIGPLWVTRFIYRALGIKV